MFTHCNKCLVAILLIIFCVSCIADNINSMEKLFKQLPNKFDFYIYKDGFLTKQGVVTEGDKKYDELKSWLLAHKRGWIIDYNTYVSGELYVAKKIKINVLKNSVIINYLDGSKWKQMSIKNNYDNGDHLFQPVRRR